MIHSSVGGACQLVGRWLGECRAQLDVIANSWYGLARQYVRVYVMVLVSGVEQK